MHIRIVLALCVAAFIPGCDEEEEPQPTMSTTMPSMPSSGGGGGECNEEGDDCLTCTSQYCCDALSGCANDQECTDCAFGDAPCQHPTFVALGQCQESNCAVECGLGSADSGDPSGGGGGGPGDACDPNMVPSGCANPYICLTCPDPDGLGESPRCVLGGCP